MTHPPLPALAALLLSFCLPAGYLPAGYLLAGCPPARAATLALPGCALLHSTALHEGGPHGAGFDADRPDVLLPALPDAVLHAAHLHADARGPGISDAALEQAATAAAATLLLALSDHRDACPGTAIRDALDPLAQALGHGGSPPRTR